MGQEQYFELSDAFEASGIMSTHAIKARGFDAWWRQHVAELWGAGKIADRLTRGVWVSKKRLPSATDLVAHVVRQLAPRGLVGVRAAAALHGLLEAPEVVDVVMPRDAWRTRATWPFAHRRFDVTRTAEADQVVTATLEPGVSLSATSAPRTLIDLIRFRKIVGIATAALALRRFLDLGGSASELHALARRCRAVSGLARLEPVAVSLSRPTPVTDCRPLCFPPGLPVRAPPLFSVR